MLKRLAAAVIAVLALGFLPGAYFVARAAGDPSPDFSPARYMRDVIYLASDELKGRGDGSPELNRAADYIATEFRRAGLKPAGEHNSYFQAFDITTGAQPGSGNRLSINGKALTGARDFVPIAFSSSGNVAGPLVFAGYGITAPEYHYDDYAGLNVSGKIVLVLGHEPQENDRKSIFAGANLTRHATVVTKAVNAKLHGARAILIVTDFNDANENISAAAATENLADEGIAA